MRKIHVILLALLLTLCGQLWPRAAWAIDADGIDRLADDFVVTSVVVTSAGDGIGASFGHCGIRMRCATFGLDYVYDMEMEEESHGLPLGFVLGQLHVAILTVPTKEYVERYRTEGRQVVEYMLCLPADKELLLWQRLDERLGVAHGQRYRLISHNCATMVVRTLQDLLRDRHYRYTQLPPVLDQPHGAIFRYVVRHMPWEEFLFMTLFGNTSDATYPVACRPSPETVASLLATAVYDDTTGVARPLLVAEGTPLSGPATCLPHGATRTPQSAWTTPAACLGLLLLLTALLTVAELLGGRRWQRVVRPLLRGYDVLLLGVVTVVGCVLLYTTFVSHVFDATWNWYLIVYNPLPALVGLVFLCRHAGSAHTDGRRVPAALRRVCRVWLVVLLLFIAATPLSVQLDWTHQLFTAILALRCGSFAFGERKLKQI